MSYATVQDALDLYGSDYVVTSADRDNDGVLDEEAFQRALDAATNRINGFLVGKGLPLPLDPVPEDIKVYCIDLAVYIACPTADVLTESKTDRYKDAIEYLKMVARGQIRLVQDDAEPSATPAPGLEPSLDTNAVIAFEVDTDSRAFTRRSLQRI